MPTPNLEPRGWSGRTGPDALKYGASMGRPSLIPSKEVLDVMKVSLAGRTGLRSGRARQQGVG